MKQLCHFLFLQPLFELEAIVFAFVRVHFHIHLVFIVVRKCKCEHKLTLHVVYLVCFFEGATDIVNIEKARNVFIVSFICLDTYMTLELVFS